MKKLYKYTGTISAFSYRKNNPNALAFVALDLHDMRDDDKAPVRIEAVGGLADYISSIEGTDAEERYIASDWYYDDLLFLHRIEVPSTEPGKPAKIIAQHDPIEPQVTIFGPADYIETSKPEPMDDQQRRAWRDYNAEDEYRYTPRRSNTKPAAECPPSRRTPWTGRTGQSDPTPRTKPNHKTEVHKMKTAGYWPCRNEIINAHLSTPHKYEPFTELFDVERLAAIRDKYGADLYRECYADAAAEVMQAANVTTHLRALGVDCKPIFTPDNCHVNFIAVFSLGSTTAPRINEIATKSGLCVLFQCPTH